jgi:excinuclease ABC subunit C
MGSTLDQVPGVGPARRAAMLKAFGSVAALAAAEPDEIAQRAGVPRDLAERVATHLRSGTAAASGPAEGSPPAGLPGRESLRRPA